MTVSKISEAKGRTSASAREHDVAGMAADVLVDVDTNTDAIGGGWLAQNYSERASDIKDLYPLALKNMFLFENRPNFRRLSGTILLVSERRGAFEGSRVVVRLFLSSPIAFFM